MLWKYPGEQGEVRNIIHGLIHGYEDQVQELLFQTRELRDYAERQWESKEQQARAVIEVHTKIRNILAKVDEISRGASEVGRSLEKVDTLRKEIQAIQQHVLAKF